MPVYTEKEYRRKQQNKRTTNSSSFHNAPPLSDGNTRMVGEGEKPSSSPPSFRFYLMHPENGVDDLQNFEDVLNIDGKEYARNCVNGIVQTTEQALAEFLVNKGYQLMEKVKI